MLKYLFLGSRSSGALEPTVRAEDEALEDVVLVVRAQREKESFGADVAVYAPAAAGSSATRLITTLAGPNRHILRSDEADRDADKAEEFKARAFVDMVRGCKRVAFPLDSPPAGAEASPGHVASSPVERWPLVQAYGNADLATGGFFTMVHSVSDATAAVGALLSHVDAHALRSVACSAASTLQQQMSLTVALAAARRTPARRATMSVQLLADALRNFAEFSAMQAPDGDAHVPPAARVGDAEPGPAGEASAAPAALCGAGVVVGEATGAEDPAAALAAPPATPLAEAGAGGSPALHGVAEAWDPASGLRASRVLFLSAPRAPSGPEAVLRNVHAALLASHRAALAALSSLVDASSAGAFPPPGELAAALLRSSARVWRRPAAARSLPRGTRAADLLSVRIETVDGCGRVSGVAVASKAGVASSSASAASGSPTPPPFGRTLVRVRSFIGPLPSGLGGLAVGDTLVAVPRASLLPPMFRPADSSGEVGGAAADDEAPETPTPTGDGAPSGGSSGEAPGGEAAGAGGAHAAPPGSGGSVVVNLTAAFPHGAVLDCLAGGAGQLASEAAEAMAGEGDDALSDSPAQSQASMTGLLGKEIAGSRVRNVAMLLGGTVTPSDQVSLVAYEDGLLLRSPGRGSLALSFSKHVAGVRVVSGKAAASAVGLALADPDARRAAVQAWAGAGLDELAASADAFDRAADSKGAAGMLGLGGSAAGRASTSLSASRLEALTCPPDVLVISLFGADTAAASNGGGGGASGGTPAAGTGGAAAAGAAAAASGAGGSSHVEATAAAGEQSPAQAAQATPARSSTSVPWAEAAPLWSTSRLEQTPSLALGLVLPAGSTERSSVLANLRRWSRSVETAALERRLAADDDSAAAPVQPKPSAEAVESAFRLAGAGEDNLPAGLRPAYADTALAPLRTAWTALDACEKARLGDAATVDRILCSGSRSGAAEAEATAVPAAAVAAGAPGWLEPGVAPWGLSAEPRTDAGKAEPSSRAAAAVPVLVLCGAAGSGRSQLARAVAEASGETHSWAVARSLPSWSAAGDARASAGATTAAASVSTGTGACSVGDWSESMQPAKAGSAEGAAQVSATGPAAASAARFRTVDAVPGAAPRILAPNEAMGRVGNGAPSCGWLDLHGHGPTLIAAAAGLAAQLDGCRPVTPSPAPARSAASLTPAERRQIKDANLYAPLPEEFQFDGTGYSTLSGSSQAFHPSMAEFEERFVAEANARREAYNASLAALRERRRAEEQAAAAVWASRGEAGTKALAAVPSHASAALADPWWADLPPELPLDVNCARPYFDGADGRRSVEVPAISADEGRSPAAVAAMACAGCAAVLLFVALAQAAGWTAGGPAGSETVTIDWAVPVPALSSGRDLLKTPTGVDNQPLRVLVVVGTRPEAIKMAPLVWALKTQGPQHGIQATVLSTKQHKDMVAQFLSLFEVNIDKEMDIPDSKSRELAYLTADVMKPAHEFLADFKPHVVLVQGDTTSAMVLAMAAFYQHIPVGHVEAGLRTYDMEQPFPEEMNRQVISRFATLHFTPTKLSACALLAEGIPPEQVVLTGNTVIDTFKWTLSRVLSGAQPEAKPMSVSDKARSDAFASGVQAHLRDSFSASSTLLELLTSIKGASATDVDTAMPNFVHADGRRVVLLTTHRRENHGTPLRRICAAVIKLAAAFPDVHFVYPVHPNPKVSETVTPLLGDLANVHLLPPLGYDALVFLMSKSVLVLTDSGGLQEEATFLARPVLVMRKATERLEGVIAGAAELVGTHEADIIREVTAVLNDTAGKYRSMARRSLPYGDGQASIRTLSSLAMLKSDILDRTLRAGAASAPGTGKPEAAARQMNCHAALELTLQYAAASEAAEHAAVALDTPEPGTAGPDPAEMSSPRLRASNP
ncbi:hypothetical protein FNF28_00477 [Cafeteria roenbergensis]|uniref:UDP-N-acetylglucosamine 2-epimerase (non-hydrolyzing) n=1 Tax=Cafeteria roenbergensis TaxID=33653 RepID=A0A5A8E254_CAFRO|nr:hypothetical protein FNF28_00477 [Cafeteria roenbergensis]